MSLFVEVKSVDKKCMVIINLDEVVEIAPLAKGGCAVFFSDAAGVNSRSAMLVEDEYDQFKQFVLQTVSADDVAKVVARTKQSKKEVAPVADILSDIPKL